MRLLSAVQDELSEDLVERVKWRVSRKSAEDKVQDFVKWMKAVSGIVHHKVSSRGLCTYIYYTILYQVLLGYVGDCNM